METLDLEEAAAFLKMHPETLRQRAKTGKIPGVKAGKSWVFLEEDLVSWLRNQYRPSLQVSQGEENVLCNSQNAAKKVRGGLDSPHQTESEYSALLELPTSD